MKTLQKIWADLANAGYETDKGSVHSYIDVYQDLFSIQRVMAKTFLEIGLFHGHSMRMWEQYFVYADVHGIDCSDQPIGGMADLRPMIAEGVHKIHIMDATNKEQVDKEFGDMKFDIVIDDGNHNLDSQLKTIEIFKPRMNEGGCIVVEDIQDLDNYKDMFLASHDEVDIIDLRKVKNRYDDALIVLKF